MENITEKVYCYDHPSAYNHDNSALIAAMMNNNNNEMWPMAAMMNGGMGNGMWNNPLAA